MSAFLESLRAVVQDLLNSRRAVSFADCRRMIGEGSRPLECTPCVEPSGICSAMMMESVLYELKATADDFLSRHRGCDPISDPSAYVDRLRPIIFHKNSNSDPLLIPAGELVDAANAMAVTYFGVAPISAGQQAQLLTKNLKFLREFSVEDISISEWSPELTVAAGIKLIPDLFFGQSSAMPLLLLVLPLWLRARGHTGNSLPASGEEYIDKVVRMWLWRCTRRGDPCLCNHPSQGSQKDTQLEPEALHRRSHHKFSYIVEESDNSFRVMSLPDMVIDGRLAGSALLSQVTAVLKTVGEMKGIPRRPRNRLRAVGRWFENMHTTGPYKSLMAQILLRNCEVRLIPDPRKLLSSEDPIKIMRLIWHISRHNIPTIITLPRATMCALTEQSLWFNILQGAKVPTVAILGFPGPLLHLISGDVAALRGGALSVDKGDGGCLHLSAAIADMVLDPSLASELRSKCVTVLDCSTEESAMLAADAIYAEAKAFAVTINAAIDCLREERLLREDILAHCSNAWGTAMRCIKLSSSLYAGLGRVALAKELANSHRMIANHFAPDIYPWAHAISLCNGYISGYSLTVNSSAMGHLDVVYVVLSIISPTAGDSEMSLQLSVRVPAGHVADRCPVSIPIIDEIGEMSTGLISCITEDAYNILTYRADVYFYAGNIPDIRVGQELQGTWQYLRVYPTSEYYDSCFNNLVCNLNGALKGYFLNIVQSCTAYVPEEVKTARNFDCCLKAWDRCVPEARELCGAPCTVSEDDILAAMNGHTRPPCSDKLDIDAADGLAAAVTRFNRSDIIRIMCLMKSAGRHLASLHAPSTRPTAVSLVWAVLRGVDDRDWVHRFGD